MESKNLSNESLLNKLNSSDESEIEGGINYLCKTIKPKDFMKIIDQGFNISKIYSNIENLNNTKIASSLPEILNKISAFQGDNIFCCFNGCGGCLLAVFFIIVASNPNLEEKIYNYLINYLGDFNGCILEKKSFFACAQKTEKEFEAKKNEKNVEFCERIKEGVWKDYVQGMGLLFSNDDFVEKTKENSRKVNTFVEEYIKSNNGFNKKIAQEIINELKNI